MRHVMTRINSFQSQEADIKLEVSAYNHYDMNYPSWVYIYRYSKLGASRFWNKRANHDIESEGRSLCQQIIKYRMERMRINHTPIMNSVFDVKHKPQVLDKMIDMIDILVAAYPETYTDIAARLTVEIKDERALCKTFGTFAEELFKNDINWSLIIALLAFSGSLAVECVHSGRSILVRSICDWTALFIAIRLRQWIEDNGGWVGMIDHFSQMTDEETEPSKFSLALTYVTDILKAHLFSNKMTWLNLLFIILMVFSLCHMYKARYVDVKLPTASEKKSVENFLFEGLFPN